MKKVIRTEVHTCGCKSVLVEKGSVEHPVRSEEFVISISCENNCKEKGLAYARNYSNFYFKVLKQEVKDREDVSDLEEMLRRFYDMFYVSPRSFLNQYGNTIEICGYHPQYGEEIFESLEGEVFYFLSNLEKEGWEVQVVE